MIETSVMIIAYVSNGHSTYVRPAKVGEVSTHPPNLARRHAVLLTQHCQFLKGIAKERFEFKG
jgi:hypothetical protein